MIKREYCILTGEKLNDLKDIKSFPIKMGYETSNKDNDIFYDMEWGYSENSGLIQLKNLINPELLYSEYHNSGSVGNIWKKHHKDFAKFIMKNKISNVLEIGGSSGNLFNYINKQNINWNIIEPREITDNGSGINYINGFFEEYNFTNEFDAIVHSHVFEHTYNPINFLEKIYLLLENDGFHFISIPNMKYWVSNGYCNALNFEHTFYVDEHVITAFLNASGFEITEIKITDHSIFIATKKTKIKKSYIYDFNYSKNLFLSLVQNIKHDVKNIQEKCGDNNVFLFGAHVFSQYLINFGLNENRIISILDNDKTKHGKRLYGTSIWIESPEILSMIDSPTVIVKAGIYTKEIKSQLKKINNSIIII